MMSDQEMWQWIHYSYGDDLELSSDDNDYIALSAEDKVQFQHKLQIAERCLDIRLVSDTAANKVCMGWYGNNNVCTLQYVYLCIRTGFCWWGARD